MSKLFIVFEFFFVSIVGPSFAQVCELDGEGMPRDPDPPGAFVINSPAANKRNSTFVDLTWGVSTNSSEYIVQYRLDGATTPWLTEVTITNGAESARVDGLTPNTLYEFRVVSKRICTYCAPTCVTRSSSTSDVITDIRTAPDRPDVGTPSTSQIHQEEFTAVWTSETGANNYRLDVATDDDFGNIVSGYNNVLTGNVTSFRVENLSKGRTYYYRVRAVNSFGSVSPSSADGSATTLPPTSSLSSPTDIGQTSFKAVWTAVDDDIAASITRYQLVIDDQSNMSSPLKTITLDNVTNRMINATDIPSLTPGSRYFYRVKATNNGNFANAPFQATSATVDLLPATPGLLAAADIKDDGFTAKWQPVTATGGTIAYQLIIDDNPDMSSPLFQSNVGNVTSKIVTRADIPSLTAGAVYYYKVKATNNANFTLAGLQAEPVQVLTLPAPPVLNEATDIEQFSWRSNWAVVTSPGSISYQLQIDDSPDFSSLLYDRVVGNVTNTLITQSEIPSLQAGHRYYYRVKGSNNGDFTHAKVQTVAQAIDLLPPTPSLSASTDLFVDRFTANWQAVTTEGGTLSYQILVDDHADFASPLYVADVGNILSKTITLSEIPTISPATIYYIKVQSSNSGSFVNSGIQDDPIMALTLPVAPELQLATEIGPRSFKGRWNAVVSPGTVGYKLEVDDSEDFLTPLYQEEVGNVLEKVIAPSEIPSLQPGTRYYYRVRATNNGDFANSQTPASPISVITIPSIPILTSASDQQAISFAWDASTGASQYRLEVATDSEFQNKLPGYEDKVIAGTTALVEALVPGTLYYARMRSENESGLSDYSEVSVTITVPLPPDQMTTHSFSTSAFTAVWGNVNGAAHYIIDVSVDETFATVLPGHQNRIVDGNSLVIAGLNPGTRYYFRVRSVNNAGTSEHSDVVATITLPASPVILNTSNITSAGFIAAWEAMAGADFYEVQVALDNQFTNGVVDYNPRRVTNSLEEAVVGLQPDKLYHWRVRSGNASGVSDYSLVKVVPTRAADGTNRYLVEIEHVAYDPQFSPSQKTVRVNARARIFPVVTEFFHRKITETEYRREVIVTESGEDAIVGEWEIREEWLDELGMEFYVVVTDHVQQSSQSSKGKIARLVSSWNIPVHQFGTTVREYQMISNPYVVENNIEEMLEPIMGAYDPSVWRFVRYQSGKNVDYTDGLSKTRMERGNGYWFLSRGNINLSFGTAGTPDNTSETPHLMHLAQGWNQIGNPFPFDVDWQRVLDHNGNPATVSNLKTYDGSIESFRESNVLRVFDGGFVYADEPVILNIPVTVRSTESGRSKVDWFDAINADEQSWLVPLTLSSGRMMNTLVGFGMNPQASEGKDRFDEVTLPRFVQYLEFNAKHHQSGEDRKISRDIVPASERYTWNFTLEHNVQGAIAIQWPARLKTAGLLLLHDVDRNILVDMKRDSLYNVHSDSRNFRIYYNQNIMELRSDLQLGMAYPNPAAEQVIIPYGFANSEETTDHLQIVVTDVAGRKIVQRHCAVGGIAGLRSLTLDCADDTGNKLSPGVYVITLSVAASDSQSVKVFRNRIIIE